MEWISVKDRLPEIDEYVLWRQGNGFIFMEAIDDDWDEDYLRYFLGGYGTKSIAGPITHWMPPPELKNKRS